MQIMRSRLAGNQRSDGRWEIRVTLTGVDGAKRKTSVYGETQKAAQEAANKLLFTTKRTAHEKHTIAQLITAYKLARWDSLAAGTKRQYGPALDRIEKMLGDDDVRSFDYAFASRWVKQLATIKSLGGRSVQVHRNVLAYLFTHGMELGWCEGNPAKGVRLPLSAKPKIKPKVTPYDYRDMLARERNPVLRDLWELLGETGLRPDREALGLERSNLFYSMDMYWIRVSGSKTEAGENREIPLPDQLANRLLDREGLLFPTSEGTRFIYRNVFRSWEKTRRQDPPIACGSPYQLRKLCITRWIASGLPDDVVKHFAGHTDIAVAKNVYQRIGRERLMESLFTPYALAELTKEI